MMLTSPQFFAWRTVLMADPCVYCGGTSTGMDHIQPRASGGSNGWENRAPACATCDNAKGATPVLFFLLGYWNTNAKAQAVKMMRKRIAAELCAEFYRGNVRWPDGQAVAVLQFGEGT